MLTRHLFGYLPVNIAQAIVGFGAVIVLTRVLSPEDFGRYALAFSSAALVYTLTLTWVEAAAHRFYARAEANGALPSHFGVLIALWGIALGVLAGVSGVIFWVLDLEAAIVPAMMFALLHAGVRTGLKIALETRRAARQVARYSAIETLNILSGFGVGLIAVLAFDMGPAGPFVGLLVAALVALLFEAPHILQNAKGGKADAAEMRAYAAYGIPIAAALALDLLLAASDRFLIQHFLGPASVGAYAAGYNLAARIMDVLFVWAGMAFAPLATAAWETEGAAGVRRVASKMIVTLLALVVPAAIGLALVAEPLSKVMIGPALADEAARIVPWIAIAAVLNGLTVHYFSEAFQLTRRTMLRAALMVLPVVVNVALNLVWLPLYGLQGAVMATLVAYCAAILLISGVGRGLVALPLEWPEIAKVLVATAAMAGAVVAAPNGMAIGLGGSRFEDLATLIMKVGAGVVVYAALAWVLDVAGVRAMIGTRFAAKSAP
jgi:O-antigen/teichoic acid export membrane protein